MKKQAIIMGLAGVVILVGVGYFLNKPKTANAPETTIPDNQNTNVNQPVEVVVDYKSGSSFTPQSYRVEQGQQVVIKITSNIADEVHLHGYDLSKDLQLGEESQIAFKADKTGSFEFELEEHKITLGEIQVYPK